MKYLIVWFIAWGYRLTLHSAFYVLFNGVWLFWIFITGQWPRVSREMEAAKENTKDYMHLCLLYRQFQYHYDGIFRNGTFEEKNPLRVLEKWPVWTSCVRVLFFRRMQGNCNDSTAFARWLVKQYNRRMKGVTAIPPVKMEEVVYVPVHWKRIFTSVHYFSVVTAFGIPDLFDVGKVERLIDIETVVRKRVPKDISYVIL